MIKISFKYLFLFIPMYILFMVGFFCSELRAEDKKIKPLVYANSDWPPLTIMKKEPPYKGASIDIIKLLAKELNIELKIMKLPWKRVLHNLKKGTVDITSDLNKTPEREKFLHYLTPHFRETLGFVFYVRKGQASVLKKYEDLYKLKIGVVLGYTYFKRFDNDKKVKKSVPTNDENLLKMLLAKHIDAIVGVEDVYDYLIKIKGLKGKIEKASYRSPGMEKAWLGISKKSPYAKRLVEFNKALHKLVVKDKVWEKIISEYK